MIGQRVLTRFDWLQLYSEERKKVALVLGVEDEHHETGIKYLEQLAPLLSSACGNQWSKQSHSEFKGLLKEILRTDGLAALKNLFDRPWWQRANELGLSKRSLCANTTILIGQNSLNFTVMDQVVSCTELIEGSFLDLRSNTVSWIHSGLAKCNGNGEDEKRVLQWAKLDITSPSSQIPGAEVYSSPWQYYLAALPTASRERDLTSGQ